MSGLSLDRPAEDLWVAQPRRGFRYAADAFWLAGFALEAAGPGARTLDLGTGSGVVALLLAGRGLRVVGVDDRPEWAPAWEATLARSRVSGSVDLRAASVLDLPLSPAFELVVTNPPFFAAGSGPVSPDPWKAAARTESGATLADFVRVGLGSIVEDGTVALIVPVERAAEVERVSAELGASVAERVLVGERRALLRLRRGSGATRIAVLARDDERVRGWYTACGAGDAA